MTEKELFALSIADLYAIINYCGDENSREIVLAAHAEMVLRIKLKL